MNKQCLPSLLGNPDSNFFLRRRNLSISSNPHEPFLSQSRSSPRQQQRCDFIYASRKNQLLIRKARFRGKDLTKLCQDSLAEYLSLKSKLTDQTPLPLPLTPTNKGLTFRGTITPKFSVKLFSLEGVSRGQSPLVRYRRLKTENDPREDEDCLLGKKYSQMSLKEMVDGGEEFQLQPRAKERRGVQAVVRTAKRSRRESQEYQIDGW